MSNIYYGYVYDLNGQDMKAEKFQMKAHVICFLTKHLTAAPPLTMLTIQRQEHARVVIPIWRKKAVSPDIGGRR